MSAPWMPLYIADYLRDTRRLHATEHGAYLLLIMEYWTAGSLPDDDRQLARLACVSEREWLSIKPIIARFFGPGWTHDRIDRELATSKAKYEKRAQAGKRGGIAKAQAKQNPSNATQELEANGKPGSTNHNHNHTLPGSEADASAAGAAQPPDPSIAERELFERGKAVLGKSGGGMIADLRRAKGGNVALARASIEEASTKQDPRAFVAGVIRHATNPKTGAFNASDVVSAGGRVAERLRGAIGPGIRSRSGDPDVRLLEARGRG